MTSFSIFDFCQLSLLPIDFRLDNEELLPSSHHYLFASLGTADKHHSYTRENWVLVYETAVE